jgi:Raf kinase inhibitor-like YbhB/YbcL family protein
MEDGQFMGALEQKSGAGPRSRSRLAARSLAAGILFAAAVQLVCFGSGTLGKARTMDLTSADFASGWIPDEFTCHGAGISPPLAWSAPPAGTRSFALIITDPDAPGRTFTHWTLYDLPAETQALAEGLPAQGQLANGARQGRNDFGRIGYGGPCPPGGSAHHYVFALYALDAKLNLPPGATRTQIKSAMQGHVLARGELTVLYRY